MKVIKNDELMTFMCPGCKERHHIQVGAEDGPNWSWNGSYDKPTFVPSVHLKTSNVTCHSFISYGKIQFLGDCTHELANKIVELEDIA